MNDPIRSAWSKDELAEAAKTYMLSNFGKPMESSNRDRWYESLGLLVDFVDCLWNNEKRS